MIHLIYGIIVNLKKVMLLCHNDIKNMTKVDIKMHDTTEPKVLGLWSSP